MKKIYLVVVSTIIFLSHVNIFAAELNESFFVSKNYYGFVQLHALKETITLTPDFLYDNLDISKVNYFATDSFTQKYLKNIKEQINELDQINVKLEQNQKIIDKKSTRIPFTESTDFSDDEQGLLKQQENLNKNKELLNQKYEIIKSYDSTIDSTINDMKNIVVNHLLYLANQLYEKSFEDEIEVIGFIRFLSFFIDLPKEFRNITLNHIKNKPINEKKLPWFITVSRTNKDIILVNQSKKLFLKIPLDKHDFTQFIAGKERFLEWGNLKKFNKHELSPLIDAVFSKKDFFTYSRNDFGQKLNNENRLIARLLQMINIKQKENSFSLPSYFKYYDNQTELEDIGNDIFAYVKKIKNNFTLIVINNQFNFLPNALHISLEKNNLNFMILNSTTEEITRQSVEIIESTFRWSRKKQLDVLFNKLQEQPIRFHYSTNTEFLREGVFDITDKRNAINDLFKLIKTIVLDDNKLTNEEQTDLLFWLPDNLKYENIQDFVNEKKEIIRPMISEEESSETSEEEPIIPIITPVSTMPSTTSIIQETLTTEVITPSEEALDEEIDYEGISALFKKQEELLDATTTTESEESSSEEREPEPELELEELSSEEIIESESEKSTPKIWRVFNYLKNLSRFTQTAVATTVIVAAITTITIWMKIQASQVNTSIIEN